MLAKVNSSAIVGLDAVPVEVGVDIASQGLPSFTKVGTKWQNLSSGVIYRAQPTPWLTILKNYSVLVIN